MRHSSRRLAPSWAQLCSQISVEPYIPKGPANVKITTLYRCTGRHFRAATRAQWQLFIVLFLCFLVCLVCWCMYSLYGPRHAKMCFREWSTWFVSNQPGHPQKLARICWNFGFNKKYIYHTIQAANNKGDDQTVRMNSLICTLGVCVCHTTRFCMTWPIQKLEFPHKFSA